MIATILPSSRYFHAVAYNERKVEKGVAELVEIKHFGYLQDTGNLSADDLRDYLIKYSTRNKRIEKAQFHVAFSCKGREYTTEQLLDIAHQWLDKMGYGHSGQPILVYSHSDTPNTHIHIVTSRIDPNGNKINHNNERVRSQMVLHEIMGVDREQEMNQTVKEALSYRFETLGQFKAIIESSGFETYTDDDKETLFIKKDGVVRGKLKISELEGYYRKLDKEETTKRRKQLWSIMIKYRDVSSSKDEMAAELKSKFGISLVFLGRRDSPYGYIIVDHKEKNVYKGNDIMSIKKLMQFGCDGRSNTQEPEKIKEFINQKLKSDPDVSLFEINKQLLRQFHVCIKTEQRMNSGSYERFGFVECGKNKLFELDQNAYERLSLNGKVKWLQEFKPASWEECEVLAKFGRLNDAGRLHMVENADQADYAATKRKIETILAYKDNVENYNVFEFLRDSQIMVMRKDGRYYAVDMERKTILDLAKHGIDVSSLYSYSKAKPVDITRSSYIKQKNNVQGFSRNPGDLLKPTDGGHHANREWEINEGSWEIDDGRGYRR